MNTLWEKVKKGLVEGFQAASDKTSEFTKIGRIKIDVVAVKKEIEENLLELGGRLYHQVVEEKNISMPQNSDMERLIKKIKELENELQRYTDALSEIRENDKQNSLR